MTSLPKFSVENPVLVGVLMTAILIGGVYSGLTLVREMFPESSPDRIVIVTPYPGATPAEVEKGLSIKIEEAVKDIEHIDRIETRISEGFGTVVVTMTSEVTDIDQAVNDFKAAIDAIPRDELPEDAEETRVAKFEPRLSVISVVLFGEVGEEVLKDAGRRLRDDLLLLLSGSDVELSGTRKAELTVEMQPEKLIEYRLSLAEVAATIRQSNLDLPGGQVKTAGQNVALRTLGETDKAELIAETVVRTTPEGGVVRVRDLGRVIDGFEDSEVRGRFNGAPAVDVTVFKTGDQDAIEIATKVKAFVVGKRGETMEWDLATRVKSFFGIETEAQRIYRQALNDPYPATPKIMTHSDLARFIESRLDLLKRKGSWGLALVFCSLLLFLNWRVSFWVLMGLILSVCGAVMLMSAIGATLNLISMFGLIVVLGLIVDDAIVVGENIYARVERGEEPKLAAVTGAEEVTWPVVVAVLTTIGAFLPLMFIEGRMGDFMGVLPVVVTCALSVSLIEALMILPSHLAEWLEPVRGDLGETSPRHWLAGLARPVRRLQRHVVHDVLTRWYERLLRLALSYRYVTVSIVAAGLAIAVGLIKGGRVPIVYIQKMDSEMIIVNVEMPVGTPADQTEAVLQRIERAAGQVEEIETIYTIVGGQVDVRNEGEVSGTQRSHLGQAIIELATVEERDRTSEEIIAELRGDTADIVGVNSIRFLAMHGGPGGAQIEIEVLGKRIEDIRAGAEKLKEELAGFSGVYDIADDFEEGRRELKIELLDSARPLGLTTHMLATEVRGAFYGLEARTLQRDREDVDIRVRFPESRRRRIHELESMRIATPAGDMVPFCEVARVEEGRGFSAIRRVDQRPAVVVSADVDQSRAETGKIIAAMGPTIARLERELPGVRIQFAGSKREMAKSFGSLKRDFVIAVLAIFVMLAGLFKSYLQPLIVLTAIPFGLNGAVAGHFVMGYPMTILSMIGVVALTGIVVNDGLILVDFINKARAAGRSLFEAVIEGGKRRLRPIILTSLTTILGLAPIMTETSFQARFLIPMAISISFGLAFATVLTLLVVPAIYMIVEDFQRAACRIWYGPQPEPAAV